jgi:hypothetical protein
LQIKAACQEQKQFRIIKTTFALKKMTVSNNASTHNDHAHVKGGTHHNTWGFILNSLLSLCMLLCHV